jgi:hypothetical protein
VLGFGAGAFLLRYPCLYVCNETRLYRPCFLSKRLAWSVHVLQLLRRYTAHARDVVHGVWQCLCDITCDTWAEGLIRPRGGQGNRLEKQMAQAEDAKFHRNERRMCSTARLSSIPEAG